MPSKLHLSSLIPLGLAVEFVTEADEALVVTARAKAEGATCPLCETVSHRIHSRYIRRVSDLLCSGRRVRLHLAGDGIAIKEIVRRTGHSRKLIRQVVRGERTDVFRVRQNSLDAHLPLLDELWASGCRNAAELWRRLKVQGFRGSPRVVSEWATRRRRAEQADGGPDHQTQAGEATDVWARQDRLAAGQTDRCRMIAVIIEIASEPILQANSHSRCRPL